VFAAGLTGIFVAWRRSEDHRTVAETQTTVAEIRRKEADDQRTHALELNKLAELRRIEAEANFDEALGAVDEYLSKL
jgi:hypothetical protein